MGKGTKSYLYCLSCGQVTKKAFLGGELAEVLYCQCGFPRINFCLDCGKKLDKECPIERCTACGSDFIAFHLYKPRWEFLLRIEEDLSTLLKSDVPEVFHYPDANYLVEGVDKGKVLDKVRELLWSLTGRRGLYAEKSYFFECEIEDNQNKKTSEKLERLPENVRSKDLSKYRIRYNASEGLLILTGVMEEEKQDELLKLSKEPLYRKAIKRLFCRSRMER